MKDFILNNTKRRQIEEYFCHSLKGMGELFIHKNSNIEHITVKSDAFDKLKLKFFF